MRTITKQSEQEAGFRLDIGSYVRVLWRKKFFLFVPLVIAFVVASVGMRFLVPEFESSSLIRIGDPANVNSDVDRLVDVRGRQRDAQTKVQLEADILGSKFLDELIRELGIDKDPEVIARAELQHQNFPQLTTEELVYRRMRDFLRRRIKVDAQGPALFKISYADANPEACYVIAKAITDLYVDLQKRQTMQGLKVVSDFSETQLQIAKDRLDRSERELSQFEEQIASRGTVANPVNERNGAVAEKVRNDLELTVRAAEATLDKIKGRITSVLGSMPESDRVMSDPELAKLANDLADRREAELLVELSDETNRGGGDLDPVMTSQQAIQRRLMQLATDYFPTVSADYRPLVVEYFYQQIEIKAYRQKMRRLDEYIRRYQGQVVTAPQTETERARLREEVERNRQTYNTFQQAQRGTQIKEDAQSTELGATVFLVEAANRPVAPVRPNKVKILVLSFLFGATIGAAGLLLTEFTDSSYRNVEDVERQLGLRVLGTIPRVGNTRWQSDSARKRTIIWTAVCVTFVSVFISAFYFYGKSSREQMIDLNLSNATTTGTPTP